MYLFIDVCYNIIYEWWWKKPRLHVHTGGIIILIIIILILFKVDIKSKIKSEQFQKNISYIENTVKNFLDDKISPNY